MDKVKKLITERLIKEAEGKDPYAVFDQLINKIKVDIKKIRNHMVNHMGIDKKSQPFGDFTKMYNRCCDYEPAEKVFSIPDSVTESDIKVDSESDDDTMDKSVELAKKTDMDIKMTDNDQA